MGVCRFYARLHAGSWLHDAALIYSIGPVQVTKFAQQGNLNQLIIEESTGFSEPMQVRTVVASLWPPDSN